MNILLIEPNKVLAETYIAACTGAGHQVVWKRSGQAALDVLDDTKPDVVILELQLGIHNGIEYLYELRSQADWRHIPVVIHTFNAKVVTPEYQAALKQLEIKYVLYKPATPINQLIKTLERLVVVA